MMDAHTPSPAERFAVVMAGGGGTRFWPVSRRSRPKQFLRVLGERTLLEQAVERLRPAVPDDNILIVTTQPFVSDVRALLPWLPDANILTEPQPRNTAAAIALGTIEARRRCAGALVAAVPSDHAVADEDAFARVALSAFRWAATGTIVTLGITPVRPETAYGYIRFGDFAAWPGGEPPEHAARRIEAFVEKPSGEVAAQYLREGRYLWNAGMFFFPAAVLLEEIRAHMPDLYDALERIVPALGTSMLDHVLRDTYRNLPSVSIDYGVMEHTHRIVVIPCKFGWSDVGSWNALEAFKEPDSDNATWGDVVVVDARGNVIYADRGNVAAVLGVEDLVVAISAGRVLVCPKSRAQEVRQIVAALEERGWEHYL